jgi:hypothetical protein
MPKWIRLNKTYCIGLFALGFVALFLQELPYIIMPLVPFEASLLMEMVDKLWGLTFLGIHFANVSVNLIGG